MALRKVWLNLNGAERMMVCDPEKDSLADVLRRIGLTGTKVGCGKGECGACSVILNGKVVRSCSTRMGYVPDDAESTTIEGIGTPTHLHPLQHAWITYGGAQCGFCSPGFIVSAKALLDANPEPTREEVRDWFRANTTRAAAPATNPSSTAVMEGAAVMRGEKTMEDITFQVGADGRVYGTAVRADRARQGLRHGRLRRRYRPQDAGGYPALAVVQPGLSCQDQGDRHLRGGGHAGRRQGHHRQGREGHQPHHVPAVHPRAKSTGPLLADHLRPKVFRYGDVVAVVAAHTQHEAREAARKVKLDLEELPAYMTYPEAVAPGAAEIHPGVPNMYVVMPLLKGDDTREVLARSEHVVAGSWYTTSQPHMVMEPDVTQAYMDEEGRVTVHNKTLAQVLSLLMLGPALGLPQGKIRVIENFVGGSFGYSLSPASTALAAACTLALDGAPVTLTMTYAQHNAFTGKRAATFSNARMGCDADGKITGFEFDIAYDHGAYSEMGDVLASKGIRFAGYSYNIPAVRAMARCGASNQTYGAPYRSFGNSQALTLSESIVDMLARKAGIDPFEFRWRNIARPGDLNINSYPFKEYAYEAIMEQMKPHYEAAVAKAKAEDTPEKRRGVGIAIGGYNVTGLPSDMAEVAIELNADGSVTAWNGWEDQGQGADVGTLVLTHEALRELDLDFNDIHIIRCDTATCPITGPAGANRSHYMAGRATEDAARKLLDAMRKPDGTMRTYDEMVKEGVETKYSGFFDTTPMCIDLDPNTGHGDPTPEHNYAMFLAEVEVDAATGKTTVLSERMVYDIGAVGSVQAVDGQAYRLPGPLDGLGPEGPVHRQQAVQQHRQVRLHVRGRDPGRCGGRERREPHPEADRRIRIGRLLRGVPVGDAVRNPERHRRCGRREDLRPAGHTGEGQGGHGGQGPGRGAHAREVLPRLRPVR